MCNKFRNADLETGKLIVDSKIKPDKVFSTSRQLIRLNIGKVKSAIHDKVIGSLSEIIGPLDGKKS